MQAATAAMLPDGRRLHLQHGPIDLIVEAWGEGRGAGYARAAARFEGLLEELVAELPALRRPVSAGPKVTGPVALRMLAATAPFAPEFVTPMAAVAGSVADEIVGVIAGVPGVRKAVVNNGGDVALYLGAGQTVAGAIAAPLPGGLRLSAEDAWRGVASSGWRGRSHSLGIADNVTVIAESAAAADAAATLIANAVDLPGHAAVSRCPAAELAPDSDLGARPVTVGVGPLSGSERAEALARGTDYARRVFERGLIGGAVLMLGPDCQAIGPGPLLADLQMEPEHALLRPAQDHALRGRGSP